ATPPNRALSPIDAVTTIGRPILYIRKTPLKSSATAPTSFGPRLADLLSRLDDRVSAREVAQLFFHALAVVWDQRSCVPALEAFRRLAFLEMLLFGLNAPLIHPAGILLILPSKRRLQIR